MTRDRAADYEDLRAMVVTSSLIPRSAAPLMRHGLAAWLNTGIPRCNPPPAIASAPSKGASAVIASIFFRLVRGAVHA